MSDNDVSMVVYHHHGQLFLFAVAPDEAHWQRSRMHPALEKWHEYMATLMVTGDDGHTIVEELDEAFVFGMFK